MTIPVLTLDGCRQPKFPLGQIVITANTLQTIHPDDVRRAMTRHAAGDWGDLGDEDRRENERSCKEGGRLFSAYRAGDGTKVWVITEADRSVTTVLLPLDY